MAVTRTFSIIKPDATRRNLTGAVTKMLEEAGLRVVASKRIHMSREQAEGFYAVHKERPFFGELCDFMMSEPVVVQVLEGEDALQDERRYSVSACRRQGRSRARVLLPRGHEVGVSRCRNVAPRTRRPGRGPARNRRGSARLEARA